MEEAKCCDWVILWPCLLQIKRKEKICFSLNIEHKLAGAYYGGKECIVINYCNHPLEMYLQVFFVDEMVGHILFSSNFFYKKK